MLLLKKIAPLSVYHQTKMNLTGYVGIGAIKFQTQWNSQDSLITTLQSNEKEGVHIQIFNPENIISSKHIYYAVYFAEQAFSLSSNISNNKSIEFLIYASFQRQIKNAIDSVGFSNNKDVTNPLAYIVITSPNQSEITTIYRKVLTSLNAISLDDVSTHFSSQRIAHLQNHFQITDFELKNALLCLGNSSKSKFEDQDDRTKTQALLHIATERMSQLLMENFKSI